MTDRDLSDTPRTDAMCKAGYAGYDGALADFARQLERELAEARAELEVWSRRYADLEAMYLAAKQS